MSWTLLAAVAAGTAGAAASQDVSSHDPASIAAFLTEAGYKAELTKDGGGDPMIRSAAGGTNFAIYFYNCKDHWQCADISFHAGYDFAAGKEPAATLVSGFNREFRFARATIDEEKDPHLSMDVLFTDGRLWRKAFGEHLDVWVQSMTDFEKKVGW